jgi:hypothetical protein
MVILTILSDHYWEMHHGKKWQEIV